METKWLEDFVTLADTSSFSRAAESRHVTQPAFSRRIRSLEAWVGTDLIDRTVYPTKLTPAGQVFYEQALDMLAQINGTRALLRGQRTASVDTVDFAMAHALALNFFPRWLKAVEAAYGPLHSRLVAGNVHDAVLMLVEGGCDLVFCYHHPDRPVQLDPARYEMLNIGTEVMRAYASCDAAGKPKYRLPAKAGTSVPFLSYGNHTYLGRMVELILQRSGRELHLKTRFETDMAESLKMMAIEGHGVAFLPSTAVERELAQTELALAATDDLSIAMEIRLYRERRCTRAVVNQLWQFLVQQGRAAADRSVPSGEAPGERPRANAPRASRPKPSDTPVSLPSASRRTERLAKVNRGEP
jgi:DNA-binding transcriptional LysR family regulator